MRRLLPVALVLLLTLSLGGCDSRPEKVYQTSIPLAKNLVMQVSERDALTRQQAERFAKRVGELSEGRLIVQIESGFPDCGTIGSGEADFAFVSNTQMAQQSELFLLFSMPFIYDNARHMSTALNSDELLSVLTQRLDTHNLIPMAALYNGTSCLVTNEGALRVPSDFNELVIALRTNNPEKITMFGLLGAQVLPYSQNSLAPLFGTQVEVLPEDLTKPDTILTIDTLELDFEQIAQLTADPHSLYLIRTYHNLTPLWLIANADTMADLTPLESAAVQEGMAGMLAGIELARQREEQKLFEQFERNGMTPVEIERAEIGLAIYGLNSTGTDRYRPPEWFDRRIHQMIQNYA